jgi:dTDP-4-dehydrorhamnose reductase
MMEALVLGADSRIGKSLLEALRSRGDKVHCTSRRHSSVGRIPLDFASSEIDAAVLPHTEVAFFCVALSRFSECRANPLLARQVNVVAPAKLARALSSRGTHTVLLSTSAVYDGSASAITSNRMPRPLTDYGRLKAEAEAMFLSLGDAASILRLTKVLSSDMPLFTGWIQALASGNSIRAFSDLGLAPVSMVHAVNALLAVGNDRKGGIYQASAAADISYFDAACHLAHRLGADPKLVTSQRGAEAGIPVEQLTLLSSLDASRLSTLTGKPAPDPYAVIDEVFGPAITQARARITVTRC